MLLPLHAGYDMIFRGWAELHPTVDPCVEDASLDFELDACLPYLFPLRSVREECAARYESLPYAYDGLATRWLEPARNEQAKASAGLKSETQSLSA